MRHRSTKKALSRKSGPRRALLKNLVQSFIVHGSIVTTPAKAKLVRSKTERLITIGRDPSLHNRRQLLAFLPTKKPVDILLEKLSPQYKERKGGYTRMTKLTSRKGDGAGQVKLEFV
ncbi:MAG: 50S ribosomal protein L17 [Patescibacteria group bacterium]|jgi:large subunit ribosomal protein L17